MSKIDVVYKNFFLAIHLHPLSKFLDPPLLNHSEEIGLAEYLCCTASTPIHIHYSRILLKTFQCYMSICLLLTMHYCLE